MIPLAVPSISYRALDAPCATCCATHRRRCWTCMAPGWINRACGREAIIAPSAPGCLTEAAASETLRKIT